MLNDGDYDTCVPMLVSGTPLFLQIIVQNYSEGDPLRLNVVMKNYEESAYELVWATVDEHRDLIKQCLHAVHWVDGDLTSWQIVCRGLSIDSVIFKGYPKTWMGYPNATMCDIRIVREA